MSYIVWCDLFQVNVPYIDNQHKALVRIVNNFHECLKNGECESKLFSTLNKLTNYAEEHFKDEEDIMDLSHYPTTEFEQHKKDHEKLILEIFELNQHLQDGNEKTLFEVEFFLNNWLIKHILESDKLYQPYCSKIVNFQPSQSLKSE